MRCFKMKIFLLVCALCSIGASEEIDSDEELNAVEGHSRNPKFFPFFSIIRFENTECGGSNSFNGTCFTRRECNDLGGSYSGTCANRRGVCCIIQKSCGSTTNVNNTYFTNVGYPGSFSGGSRCSIAITRCNSDICQLRLEFLDLQLGQPNGDGSCLSDALTVTGGSSSVPRICGENSGQHVYIDFDGDNPITVSIDASSAVSFSRRWNIKLTQIACNCPTLAPSGCLMYYTSTSGVVNSFNYGTMQNQALSLINQPGTREIANLNYGVCIRMSADYCGIRWSQADSSFSFTVTGDVPGTDLPATGVTGQACVTDFVIIPNGDNTGVDRYCGLGFPTVTTYTKPFVLYVVTNENEGLVTDPSPDIANRGFSLRYEQLPCTP